MTSLSPDQRGESDDERNAMGINFRMLREIEAARDAAREVAEQTGDVHTQKLASAVDKLATQMLWLMPEPGSDRHE